MTDSLLHFFKTIRHWVVLKVPGIPTVAVLLLIMAAVLLMVIVILTVRAMKRASKKEQSPNAEIDTEQELEFRLPPIGGWVSEFFTRQGFFKVSTLSLSFLRSLELLKKTIDTYNYKYQLPWYLLVGSENSGKTSLLEGAELNMPLGKQDFGIPHAKPECQWWFLSRGIILDIRGDFLIRERIVSSNERGWRSLLILLSRYRAARPINGIIVTIPARELYGRDRLSIDDLSLRAAYIAQKLSIAQNGLGLRLPVYIVVTKTDVVPGFQSFCSAIPLENSQNMLGWSSPYNLNVPYTESLLEEGFATLLESLQKIQLEVFSENRLNSLKDGVFVFPQELLSLKGSLGIYLNHLFKGNSYQQTIALRGIYFCGDSGLTTLSIITGITNDKENGGQDVAAVGNREELGTQLAGSGGGGPSPSSTTKADSLNTEGITLSNKFNIPSLISQSVDPPKVEKIFFVADLINQKILPEQGLAIPQSQKLININRVLNVAKIATLLFVLFGSIGLYSAYSRFATNRIYIVPILGKMNGLLQDLQRLKLNQPASSGELFDNYANELIQMMEQFNNTSFFSFFVPASWFSPLGRDLNNSLKVAYQQIIIRTIYIDLLLRARDLLHLRPTPQDLSISIGQLLVPTATPEYKLLAYYVESIAILQDKVQKFNDLRNFANFKDLEELVIYTFGSALPTGFADNYHLFQSLLKNTVFPAIDLKPYKNLACETLEIIYQNFIDSLFNGELEHSLPNRIKSILTRLTNDQKITDLGMLRAVSEDLAKVLPNLGNAGKTWLDREYFDCPPEFEQLLIKVEQLELFGKPIAQYLVDRTAAEFINLKQQLHAINLLVSNQNSGQFSGQVYIQDANSVDVANRLPQGLTTSQGLIQIAKSLIGLFAEPYMHSQFNITSGRRFIPLMPPGKIIYWDSKLIQLACDMAKRFEEFSTREISNFPPILHEKLKILAHQSLQLNIIELVARAQSFVDLPTNLSQALVAEEILRSKIADVCEVAPKFTKLLEILNNDAAGIIFVELRDLLASTGYWLLSQVEIMLQNLTPYTMQDSSFNWWNGQPGAALAGYSAYDLEDLKSYIQLQRQQIQNMALNYAKPLVNFLTSPVMNEAKGDKALLRRWSRIVEQTEAYLKKQPGNSLRILEDFIFKELNYYSLKTVFSTIPIDSIQNPSGDYFLEVVRVMKKATLSRAEIIQRQQSIANYQELVSFFNKFLKNKFPFVGNNLRLTMAEAEPEDIRTFFKKYNDFGGTPREILNQVYQLGEESQPALTFLKEMADVKDFFATFLEHKAGSDVPSFDFAINFRINRERELGGEMIVDWTFKPDEDSLIHKSDKLRKGRWIYGNPVQLDFRWPQGEAVNLKPIRDQKQPFLNIDDKKASFIFSNKWALLWLLRLQMANKSEYNVAQLPDPQVLKFVIPLSNSQKAVVYNSIALLLPAKNPKAEEKATRLPTFPSLAPALPAEVLDKANKPVLTEKQIEIYKAEELDNIDNFAPKAVINTTAEGDDKVDEKSKKTKDGQEDDSEEDNSGEGIKAVENAATE